MEHDGRRHRLGLHLGEVNLHHGRLRLARRAVVVVASDIRCVRHIRLVVCEIRGLVGTDVVAGTAIDHTATARVSALVNARLVDVRVLA